MAHLGEIIINTSNKKNVIFRNFVAKSVDFEGAVQEGADIVKEEIKKGLKILDIKIIIRK